MFTWNYRLVNNKRDNGGEDWYCLQEVVYNKAGQPTGHAAPCLGSEDMEGMQDVWQMMQDAFALPPLQDEDFVKYEPEEDDDE